MMLDCKLDVTGAPVIGFSAWLARPVQRFAPSENKCEIPLTCAHVACNVGAYEKSKIKRRTNQRQTQREHLRSSDRCVPRPQRPVHGQERGGSGVGRRPRMAGRQWWIREHQGRLQRRVDLWMERLSRHRWLRPSLRRIYPAAHRRGGIAVRCPTCGHDPDDIQQKRAANDQSATLG